MNSIKSHKIQWVTKKKHSRYTKVISIYLNPCLKSFQMIFFFWNPVTKLADIFKNAAFPEKSKLLKKICHFIKFNNFFSWIESLGIELTYKPVLGSKIVTQPLQVKLDVFALFLWIWFLPAVIKTITKWKKTYYQKYAPY